MSAANHMDAREVDELYTRYVQPLERKHTGDYAAVTLDGRIVIGSTLLDAVEQAAATLGPDNVVFKVGERTVGKGLCLTIR